MQSRIIIYSTAVTPRLRYIAEELLHHLAGLNVIYTPDKEAFLAFEGARINYSAAPLHTDEFRLHPMGLLFENDIRPQQVPVTGTKAEAVLYSSPSGDFPFDIFAAAFYLLSRYEEYLPHTADRYGRFDHTESIAFKNGFLQIPLVNTWLERFKEALAGRFPQLRFVNRSFQFVPTYDIDMAYSYLHKGLVRNVGALCRSLLKGEITVVRERIAVLRGKQPDPFDAFEWLHALHSRFALQPIYFFLVAQRRGIYDKNISPRQPVMQQLIRSHRDRYTIGIHPSWAGGDKPSLPGEEKSLLESITGGTVVNSRQHYLRMHLPVTYQQLIDNSITHDFSMGYGGMNGFRASVANDFRWYHLEKEETTTLRVHPFCFMDATAYYHQKLSSDQAFDELLYFFNVNREVNGTMMTIWHNNFLGPHPQMGAWKKTYERFLSEIICEKAAKLPGAVS